MTKSSKRFILLWSLVAEHGLWLVMQPKAPRAARAGKVGLGQGPLGRMLATGSGRVGSHCVAQVRPGSLLDRSLGPWGPTSRPSEEALSLEPTTGTRNRTNEGATS